MRKPSEIAELRDKDRVLRVDDGYANRDIDDAMLTEGEWLRLFAQREREQMRPTPADERNAQDALDRLDAESAPRQYARPFPARAFLAFCVAGCFAWLGIVAALRWAMQ